MDTCTICTPHRGDHPRTPRTPPICDACRNTALTTITTIKTLHTELTTDQPPEPDTRQWERPKDWKKPTEETTTTWCDPISALLPTMAPAAKIGGDHVTGSREAPIPVNLDHVDLAAPPRIRWGLDGLTAQGQADHEHQIGQLPIATILTTWARDWAHHRSMREHPPADVPGLCDWLHDRTQDTYTTHPDAPRYHADIRSIRADLNRILGHLDIPDYKRGIPCPQCGKWDLVRPNGSDYIECRRCPGLLSPTEYDQWTAKLGGHAEKLRVAPPKTLAA
jgi:hypothetical protein